MDGNSTSAYLRVRFPVGDPSALDRLLLRVKYDDGFVAYLNGVRIAEANAPAAPTWNAAATVQHDDAAAVLFEEVDVSAALGDLAEGENLLAIHGLNASLTSSDFLIAVELDATLR